MKLFPITLEALSIPYLIKFLLQEITHHVLSSRITTARHDVAIHVNCYRVVNPGAFVFWQHLGAQDACTEGFHIVVPVGGIRRQKLLPLLHRANAGINDIRFIRTDFFHEALEFGNFMLVVLHQNEANRYAHPGIKRFLESDGFPQIFQDARKVAVNAIGLVRCLSHAAYLEADLVQAALDKLSGIYSIAIGAGGDEWDAKALAILIIL